MSEFKREERYIVVKLKHLAGLQVAPLRNFLRENRVPTLDCVVVEQDWPEYEKVWRSIERRMTGQPAEDFDRVTAERDAALGREAALREELEEAQRVLSFSGNEADAYSTAALHEELASVNSDKEAYAQNAIDLRKRVDALQALLTAADEALDKADDEFSLMSLEAGQRMDVLEGLLRDWLKDFGCTHCGLQRLKERTQAALKPAAASPDFRIIGTEKMPPMEYDEP